MQCAQAPLDPAFRAVHRWYSVGMMNSPAEIRSHAKLRGCLVLDFEKGFLRHLLQNMSIWTALMALKSVIAAQSPDERGILRRLYYVLCRTVAALFDDSFPQQSDDDDYHVFGGDVSGRSRITDAKREYFDLPISFDKSVMASLTSTVGETWRLLWA